MKKTIAVITLALLMVASLFAENTTEAVTGGLGDTKTKSVNTKVVLTLDKTQNYAFGITKGVYAPESTKLSTDPSTISVTHNTEIELTRNTTNKLDVDSTDAYYLSYFFYEYDGVTLSMSVDGDLYNKTAYDKETGTKDVADYKIPYYITVATKGVTDNAQDISKKGTPWTSTDADFKINSTTGTTDANTFKLSYTATDKLGEYRWASLKLTIAPQTTTNTLKGKVAGTYESKITITVTAS